MPLFKNQDEITLYILSFALSEPKDAILCELVNKHWKTLSSQNYIWKSFAEKEGLFVSNEHKNKDNTIKTLVKNEYLAQNNKKTECKVSCLGNKTIKNLLRLDFIENAQLFYYSKEKVMRSNNEKLNQKNISVTRVHPVSFSTHNKKDINFQINSMVNDIGFDTDSKQLTELVSSSRIILIFPKNEKNITDLIDFLNPNNEECGCRISLENVVVCCSDNDSVLQCAKKKNCEIIKLTPEATLDKKTILSILEIAIQLWVNKYSEACLEIQEDNESSEEDSCTFF